MRTSPLRPLGLAASALTAAGLLAACSSQSNTTSENARSAADSAATKVGAALDTAKVGLGAVKPTGPKPAWGPDLVPQMQVVLEQLQSFNPKPLPSLTPAQARKQPGAAEAAQKQLRVSQIPEPPMACDTTGRVLLPGVRARIYTPKGGAGPFPVIVYYHGGGWVIATNDTYRASAQALCEQTGAVVVSVEYRKAPEHKFPTAHDDAFAAYQYVLKNAAAMKGDPSKVAVVGESAGGNLACAVSMLARDRKVALPKYQVLVYPIAGYDQNTPSYQASAAGYKPLDKAAMGWFFKQYLRTPADGKDPRINLVGANLKSLPPTTIIAAEYDPLASEGKTLADNLQKAGVKVNYQLYRGTVHEFFGMAAVVPQAKVAQTVATDDLKKAFK